MRSENFKAAIRASGLTMAEAASLAGVSVPTMYDRVEHPGECRMNEIKKLYDGMNDIGKRLLRETVEAFF